MEYPGWWAPDGARPSGHLFPGRQCLRSLWLGFLLWFKDLPLPFPTSTVTRTSPSHSHSPLSWVPKIFHHAITTMASSHHATTSGVTWPPCTHSLVHPGFGLPVSLFLHACAHSGHSPCFSAHTALSGPCLRSGVTLWHVSSH